MDKGNKILGGIAIAAIVAGALVWVSVNTDNVELPANENIAANSNKLDQADIDETTTEDSAAKAVKEETPADAKAEQEAPAFDTVRVEQDGMTVVAGQADAGEEVSALVDGKIVGKAVADAQGNFVIVTDLGASDNAQEMTLQTTDEETGETVETDEAIIILPREKSEDMVAMTAEEVADMPVSAESTLGGGAVAEEADDATTDLAVSSDEGLVADVSDEEPAETQMAQAEPKNEAPLLLKSTEQGIEVVSGQSGTVSQVTLDLITYSEDGDLIVSGRATPGLAIRIYIDGVSYGDALVETTGHWSRLLTETVAPGTHMMRLDEIDAEGNVVSRVETPFLREEPSKIEAVAEAEAESAAAQARGVEDTQPERVIVQAGNSLWRIAENRYGQGTRYTLIFDANRELIKDPDLIYPGQIFELPNP